MGRLRRDYGFWHYPMVTSSNTIAGYGAVGGSGIPPYEIKEVITVVKAYSSAVGAGEFVSEILARKRMSCGAEAATAESMGPLPAVPEEWDGSI